MDSKSQTQPKEQIATSSEMTKELATHLALVDRSPTDGEKPARSRMIEQLKISPLHSSKVRATFEVNNKSENNENQSEGEEVFPQYGLLGQRLQTYGYGSEDIPVGEPVDNLIYTNSNAPWSTFICGSQGSGKSHTLSCMLENVLLAPSRTGKLARPLTGLVLHYDRFSSIETGQPCEAAYLCSSGIPVRVLVSPSHYQAMKKLYENLEGLPEGAPKPVVSKLKFVEKHLSISMMKTLMAVDSESQEPLYMEIVTKILREMAQEDGNSSIDFNKFKSKLAEQALAPNQKSSLNLRMSLLESFLEIEQAGGFRRSAKAARSGTARQLDEKWKFNEGSLTIVDLSCPFFLVNTNREANELTESLLTIIRQQRHLGTRLIIATQEPNLSPKLLDLCDVTIVHRFTSPEWFKALQDHLAGAVVGISSDERSKFSPNSLFTKIVLLDTGEALVFSANGVLDILEPEGNCKRNSESTGLEHDEHNDEVLVSNDNAFTAWKLGPRYFRMKVRMRTTTDGGRSILAK
ncbi:conserved hypothetical protein [Coccidioides posadasii str. Silveira]|uniref:Uncharacterized protein n=1 Tax=Coccidioides posadasii (strain RMSCC 757 / Silveira) TaxID=443226 RepID=E9D7A7_COCPS|nr:conserved hypothetical protein [Coccidioides posadasii str. Silveira]